jgi:hypothetical protein
MRFIVFFLVLTLGQQTLFSSQQNVGDRRVGPIHRDIAESSAVAKQVIEQTAPEAGMTQFKIAIRATLLNTTDHDLTFAYPGQVYDVRVSKTGERAQDSPAGCYVNFFSDCFMRAPSPGSSGIYGPPRDVIPPNGKIVRLQYIDQDYILPPGEYTVVGIYCAGEGEARTCFKSNKIIVVVPPAAE